MDDGMMPRNIPDQVPKPVNFGPSIQIITSLPRSLLNRLLGKKPTKNILILKIFGSPALDGIHRSMGGPHAQGLSRLDFH